MAKPNLDRYTRILSIAFFIMESDRGRDGVGFGGELRSVLDLPANASVGLDVDIRPLLDIRGIQRTLRAKRYDGVQFSGHEGLFDLADTVTYPDDALGQLLQTYCRRGSSILLMSCRSARTAATLHRYGFNTAGFAAVVSDSACAAFCDGYYDALSLGLGFQDCVKAGRVALAFVDTFAEATLRSYPNC
jgi:hypothetical protein